MQISRLFEIIYILLERQSVSARELADRFEVSVRTIYRDVEHLSSSGIPVYMAKGRNGGIRLLPNFVLDKTVLTEKDKNEILASLGGLSASGREDAGAALKKLAPLFGQDYSNWIEVDFTGWSWGEQLRERFELIRDAILARQPLAFAYYGNRGDRTQRVAEPLRLVFRGQAWYVYGFCRIREDYRFFKLSRMEELVRLDEVFLRPVPEAPARPVLMNTPAEELSVVFRADAAVAYLIYDQFPHHCISKLPGGSLIVRTFFPDGEWVIPFFLSFGAHIEVLEPAELRAELRSILEAMLAKYAV